MILATLAVRLAEDRADVAVLEDVAGELVIDLDHLELGFEKQQLALSKSRLGDLF